MKKDIYAEIIKIVKRKSFIIISTIIILSTILLTIFNRDSSSKTIPFIDKISVQDYYKSYDGDYLDYINKYEKYKLLLEEEILKEEYIIKNDFIVNNKIKNDLSVSYTMLVILSIYIIFISSSSFGYEYEKNTIKLILLNKSNRKKVVISKLLALLVISLALSTIIYIVNILTTFIINTNNVFFLKDLIVYKGNIIPKSLIWLHTCEYLKLIIPQILLTTLSLFLGIVLKSSTISSIIGVVLLLSSSFITELFIKLKMSFIVYSFLPYLDYSIFLDKANMLIYNIQNNINISFNYGIICILINTILFLYISICIFDKREFK